MAILNNYSDDQLRLAARLYYLDGLPQAEVARFVSVSQAQVSRLLAMARERGIVQISVAEYQPRETALEQRLAETFALEFVCVVKTASEARLEDLRRAVTHFAAPVIAKLVPRHITVAISGGRTMRDLVDALPKMPGHGITVIQAMGNIDSNVTPVDALELGRSFAQRFDGSFLTLNTPAFVPDKRTRDTLVALPQIRGVRKHLDDTNLALIGIGTLENSVFVERGILTATQISDLQKRGAVGEICGRFYDRNGQECDSPWRDRVISIACEQLKAIPNVIAVVTGSDRAEAIAAGIRGKIIKSLVIDEAGASALLALAPLNKRKQRK